MIRFRHEKQKDDKKRIHFLVDGLIHNPLQPNSGMSIKKKRSLFNALEIFKEK